MVDESRSALDFYRFSIVKCPVSIDDILVEDFFIPWDLGSANEASRRFS